MNIELIELLIKIVTVAYIPPLVWMFKEILSNKKRSENNEIKVIEALKRLDKKAIMIGKDEERLTKIEVEMEKIRANYIKQFGEVRLDIKVAIKENETALIAKLEKLEDNLGKKLNNVMTREQCKFNHSNDKS